MKRGKALSAERKPGGRRAEREAQSVEDLSPDSIGTLGTIGTVGNDWRETAVRGVPSA